MRAREDLALIEEAVREAGKIARSYFGGSYKKWDKGKGDPVTEADLAVDKYLRETLTAARPDYGWLSEESVDDLQRLSTEFTFVVDPIDGTVAFLKNRPHFTICVALVREHLPLVGAVFNPITEECFTAIAGEGAMMNGARIHTSDAAEVGHCRMLADRTILAHPNWNNPPLTPWPPMEIETRGSIAYRLALVAKKYQTTLPTYPHPRLQGCSRAQQAKNKKPPTVSGWWLLHFWRSGRDSNPRPPA